MGGDGGGREGDVSLLVEECGAEWGCGDEEGWGVGAGDEVFREEEAAECIYQVVDKGSDWVVFVWDVVV